MAEADGTFLIGGFKSDLEQILKELHYPEIEPVDFAFKAPKGQKFNLLNVSKKEYDFYTVNGGFFTKVNGPWIDAAVRQKAKIIVVSDVSNYLYEFKLDASGTRIREVTGFGKEVHRLEWIHGYRYDATSHTMVPPAKANGLPTLTKQADYTHK